MECRARLVASILVASLLASGCFSSSYRPTRPGTVALVLEDGQRAYVRDGRQYPVGFFGGGLVDAVAGNPAAVEHARSARTKTIWGLLLTLPAIGCGSAVYGEHLRNDDGERGYDDTAVAVLGGCVAVMLVGSLFLGSAEADRLDAINVFNDGAGRP